MKKLLTIAIPTYNRSSSLDATLLDLVDQIDEHIRGDIELLVSDNNSSDSTEEVVEKYIKNNFDISIKYNKNLQNLGFDGNCHVAMEKASGEFVWILSDDDKVCGNAIKTVYRQIENNKEVSFVYVNYNIKQGEKYEESRCKININKVVDGESFMIESNLAFTFVSSCIIRRSEWVKRDYMKYIGTRWYHAFVARDLVLGAKVLMLAGNLITMNGLDLKSSRAERRLSDSDEDGYDFYLDAYVQLLLFSRGMEEVGYSEGVCNLIYKNVRASALRQIFYYKATVDIYKFKEIRYFCEVLRKTYCNKFSYWLLEAPIMYLPSFISGNIYWIVSPIYKKIKSFVK